jgi:hypothetical protein
MLKKAQSEKYECKRKIRAAVLKCAPNNSAWDCGKI